LSYWLVCLGLVTNPSFVPREYCRPVDGFGRDTAVSFGARGNAMASELDKRSAARTQHEQALRIRAALVEYDCTLTEYAALAGMNYRRATRLLGGYIVMHLADIANATRTIAKVAELRNTAAPVTSIPLG
jgi:hypothetical protein